MSRRLPMTVRILRSVFKWAGQIWPGLVAYFAYRIWFKTPRYPESNCEKKWRELALHEYDSIDGRNISIMRWGASTPGYVLLVHGWSGRATQLGGFVNAINSKGRGVISFDAPGHGLSEGKSTNIYQIASVINELVKKYGTPKAIIAHSFGGMAAALALRKYSLATTKLVTISCPNDPDYLLAGYRRYLNLNDKVIRVFNRKLFKNFSETIYDDIAAEKNLQQCSINLLIVHDKQDQIVSWQQSEKLHQAVPNSTVVYTRDLGHFRLLRDSSVIEQVVQFITLY